MTLTTFAELGLSENIVATLTALGFATPTPIQEKGIPVVLGGRDLIGLAQTGTGKTAAFGLPLIEMLLKDEKRPENRTTRTLILAPTRELVNQIGDNLRSYLRRLPLKINQVVGGASIGKQQLQLEKGTDILVATPGRLLDLIARNAISLRAVRYLVLDEADQMLDLGFIHALRAIAKHVPQKRQTLFFSATMPPEIEKLANTILKDPVTVEVTPVSSTADTIKQSIYFVDKPDKRKLLKHLLDELKINHTLIFTRTKHGADRIARDLIKDGVKAAAIHGDKSQGARQRALTEFKDRTLRVLVATDIAARGIDIDDLTYVFNYDLPNVPETYVHRIGRTGRAGRDGIAVSFAEIRDRRRIMDIEQYTRTPFKAEVIPGLEP